MPLDQRFSPPFLNFFFLKMHLSFSLNALRQSSVLLTRAAIDTHTQTHTDGCRRAVNISETVPACNVEVRSGIKKSIAYVQIIQTALPRIPECHTHTHTHFCFKQLTLSKTEADQL